MRKQYLIRRKSGHNIPLMIQMFLDPDNPFVNEPNIYPGQIISLNEDEKNRILEIAVDVELIQLKQENQEPEEA